MLSQQELEEQTIFLFNKLDLIYMGQYMLVRKRANTSTQSHLLFLQRAGAVNSNGNSSSRQIDLDDEYIFACATVSCLAIGAVALRLRAKTRSKLHICFSC